VKIFKQKVLSLKSYLKGFSSLGLLSKRKRFTKVYQNISLIGSKFQHPFTSLLSIAIKEFLYQERSFRSEAILVPISLSFSSVYSIYPCATPHVPRSYLQVKSCRCISTHKQSLQPTNHFWFNYTPFPSFFTFHGVQKKFYLLCHQFCPTTKPMSVASFPMIQSSKYFLCSPLNASPCPLHHI
jgi:hypothetical protein